jgi:Tol biopolymer transport system component
MAAVSPEGDRIAYISDRGGPDNDLWLQELRAGAPYGAPRRLTDTRGDVSHPVFSKDGEWITYYGKMNERRDIFIIRSAGGNPVRITDHEASDIHPAWSPDGTRLAFVSKRSGGSRIWIVEISGGKTVSGPERLEGVDTGAYSPVWSGDGKHIAYIGYVKGTADVWIVPVDGSYPARKLTSDAGIMRVRWDHSTGTILASGTWGTEIYDLRRIPVDTSMPVPFEPPVIFGSKSAVAFFDLSVDGRTLIYSREDIKGNIWILEGKEGDF